MCGIVGLLGFDRCPVDLGVLRDMAAVLSHRGPDDTRVRVMSAGAIQVGLGHARLRIIDLSEAAAQPMQSEDGSLVVTYNGEIYNYRELRTALETRGARFRTSSDTEVLLKCYELMGEACVEVLDGMFAFAIWDSRRRSLFLARDRAGKKPLFYARAPRMFGFASEMKALFRHRAFTPEIDAQALPPYFFFGYVPTPATFYRGVRQLPPGHTVTVTDYGEIRLHRYWDVAMNRWTAAVPSEAEAARRVRELVEDAVRKRLIADVPLGAFLSGGVDSTIVVGVMSRLKAEPVRTFSIGFAGDPAFDETRYARLAAGRFGTAHTEFVVEADAVQLVERLVWHHDGPFADSSAIPTYILSRLTRQHVTVALNGDGGDELFAGYLRFYATLVSERFPAWMRRAARGMLTGVTGGGGASGMLGRLQKLVRSVDLPFVERFSRWVAVFYEDLATLLPEFPAGAGRPAPLTVVDQYVERCRETSPLGQLLYVNLKTYLLDDLLIKMDRCSMAHGLEVRSPFLDRALMEYVMALPDSMKLRRGRTKWILRRAFHDLLPPDIDRRSKMGFGVPLKTWFRRELKEYVQDVVLAPDARLRDYVDQRYVRRLWEAHAHCQADNSFRLWALLTFEVWLRSLPRWTAEPVENAIVA